MLDEFMKWHACLLQSILEREQHPDMTTARKLPDLDQAQWRRERKEGKWQAKQRLHHGALLAQQRDSGKRKFDDISAADQEVLEDFDTKKSKKEYEQTRLIKLPYFRCKMM
jgi:hypothetical protein